MAPDYTIGTYQSMTKDSYARYTSITAHDVPSTIANQLSVAVRPVPPLLPSWVLYKTHAPPSHCPSLRRSETSSQVYIWVSYPTTPSLHPHRDSQGSSVQTNSVILGRESGGNMPEPTRPVPFGSRLCCSRRLDHPHHSNSSHLEALHAACEETENHTVAGSRRGGHGEHHIPAVQSHPVRKHQGLYSRFTTTHHSNVISPLPLLKHKAVYDKRRLTRYQSGRTHRRTHLLVSTLSQHALPPLLLCQDAVPQHAENSDAR